MLSDWSAIKGRVSNRLARHLGATPLRLSGKEPMLEEFGARGTYYVAGSLINQWSGHWNGADVDDIIGLHYNGHEIACHTFSHRRATDLNAAAMAEEIELNRRYLEGLDSSIRPGNFAYPYGQATLSRKGQLADVFRSSRGTSSLVSTAAASTCISSAQPRWSTITSTMTVSIASSTRRSRPAAG